MYPNLKLQIWKSGLRQNGLARALKIDETALSRIVNGFREPSLELQQAVAALLRCDVAWLFEREEASSGRWLRRTRTMAPPKDQSAF